MKYQPPKKLTPKQIEAAVSAYESGDSIGVIAAQCHITRQAMWDLLRRRTAMRSNLRNGSDNHFYRGGSTASDRAHSMVTKAIESGSLIRPDFCQQCEGPGVAYKDGRAPIQAHHCDYNKPLDVLWLCKQCHHEWHRTHRAIPERVA